MRKNLFKKIFISILVFFFIFFLIGLTKKQLVTSEKEINIEKTTSSEFQNLKNDQEKFTSIQALTKSLDITNQFQSFFKETEEIEKEVEIEFNKLTKNLHPDPNKSINQYQKELEKIIKSANNQLNDNSLNYQELIALAQNLAKIKPPPIFSSAHREFIKIYLKAGITLKFAQQTEDPLKQVFLYNMVKNILNEIKI